MLASKVVLVLLVLASDSVLLSQGKRIPRWWMKVAQKQGPNACVVEEVPNTGKEFWTECRYWLNRKICGRKTRIRFECCEGFEQIEGEKGCARVKPLVNLLETAESLGATAWSQYIRESGLANELETAGAYTLFAPTNEAFENMRRSLKSKVESYRGNPNNPILLYHIVPTKLKSDEFAGNTMVDTRHQGHSVRINKYSNGMTTINCALLLRKDQEATNGVVHIIDSVLDPSVGISQNVADMVLNDGRFTILAEILEKSGYINVLRTMQEPITMLAPSDEAFQKLKAPRREKIINDREARLALLQNHVMPHVICQSAITGEHRVRTVSNNKLTFNCDIEGAYVEQTKLKNNFNLGKNGIVHMIDDVLLPDRAKNLLELAESRQLVTFVDLVKRAGLEETLSHTGDYTFFVPDENAWLAVDNAALAQARRDVEYAGLLIRYHGAYGRHLTNAITDNQAIMSLDEENPLRLQVWRRALGVEDAKITEADLEAQNGVIHITNKVIFPSNQSAAEMLRTMPGERFRTFLQAMQRAETMSPPILSLRSGDEYFYTFFAPTDKAFNELSDEQKRHMRTDDFLLDVVRRHVAVNMFPLTSFEDGLLYSVTGMDGDFDIRKLDDGSLIVNGEKVKSSHMSSNGVIHVIDKAFLPSSGYTYSTIKRVSTVSSGNRGSTHSSSSSSKSSSTQSSRTTYRKTYSTNTGVADNFDENQFGDLLPNFPEGSSSGNQSPVANQDHSNQLTNTNNEDASRVQTSKSSKVAEDTTDDEEYSVSSSGSFNSAGSRQSTDYISTEDNEPDTLNSHTEYSIGTGVYRSYNPSLNVETNDTSNTRNRGTVFLSRESAYPHTSSSSSRFGSSSSSTHSSNSGSHVNTFTGNNPSSYTSFSRVEIDQLDPDSTTEVKQADPDTDMNYSHSYSRTYSSYASTNNINQNPISRSDTAFDTNSNRYFKSFNDSNQIKHKDTDSQGPNKPINYVGHHYGEDVVGHTQHSSTMPFTSSKTTRIIQNPTNNNNKHNANTIFTSKSARYKSYTPSYKKTIIRHRPYSRYLNITKTPLRHHERFLKSKKTSRIISSHTVNSNKLKPNPVSAYAFTDDTEFADGADFVESISAPEEVVPSPRQQTLIMKRQRRKRHHHKGSRETPKIAHRHRHVIE